MAVGEVKWGIGDLFNAMKGSKSDKGRFTDDEGFFQGGEEGRMFGRLRDKLGGRGTSYDPAEEEMSTTAQHAREFAENMDVSNKEDVFEMQNMLNTLGFKDYEGKELSTDAMMGDRTLSALRQLQGYDASPPNEEQGPGPWAYGDEGSSPRSWIDKLFGGTAAMNDTRQARNKMFERKKTQLFPGLPLSKPESGPIRFQRKGGNQGDAPSGPGPWNDGSGY